MFLQDRSNPNLTARPLTEGGRIPDGSMGSSVS